MMAKLRYKEDGEWKSMAPSQKEFDDLANQVALDKLKYTSQRQQDQLKVAKVEKDINDYKQVMSQVNVNQEAKQNVSGYGVVSLPKTSANGQVSVSIFGNTETDEEGNTKSTISASRLKSVSEDESEVSTQYLPNVGELRSLPNGTKDEIKVSGGKAELVKRVSDDYLVQANNVVYLSSSISPHFNVVMIENLPNINWGYDALGVVRIEGASQFVGSYENGTVNDVGKFRVTTLGVGILVEKNKYTNLTQAKEDITNNLSLTYQLAEPIVTPIEVSGTLLSSPSGTVYVENVVADAGIYENGISVLHQDLPIKNVEKLSKVDFMTGVETDLDVTKCEVSEDSLVFTHPDLTDGDIVFFTYYYDVESTLGETTLEYYDSRYVLKDDVTGKFYKVVQKVSDGELVNELVEV